MIPQPRLLLAFAIAFLLAGCGKSKPSVDTSVSDLTNVPQTAVAADRLRFDARPGSRMRINGTANMIHPRWAVESRIIGGFLDVGPGFPTRPGQTATPGKLDAVAEAFVTARSLKSIEEDGKPYSDNMDEVMYEKLLPSTNVSPRITFRLSEVTLKECPKTADAGYVCEAKGQLVVAGVTNSVVLPVSILPLADNRLKITGGTALKMTDFKIQPPSPKFLPLLKTGDEVQILFEWILAPRAAAPAETAK